MKIWIVDAFTNQPFAGNPAAVAIVDEFPEDTLCQKIAAEMNLSETAFVKPLEDNHFHLRWFTPAVEVKLCSHATLASAHILYEEGIVRADSIRFDSLSGLLQVYKTPEGLALDFPLQPTGQLLDKTPFEAVLRKKVVAAVQAVDCVIVELANEDEVRQLQVVPDEIKQLDCRGLIITARADHTYDFVSHFFAPRGGVNEDPVTGSAHCKLAHYWQQKLKRDQLYAYQASQRGGELRLNIKGDRVHILGQAVTVLAGHWVAK